MNDFEPPTSTDQNEELIDHRSWFRDCKLISVMGFSGLCKNHSPFHKGPFRPEFYTDIEYGDKVFVLRTHLLDFFQWLPAHPPPFVLISSNFDEPIFPELQEYVLRTCKILR